MSEALGYSLLATAIAFIVSSAALPLVKRISLAVRAVDYHEGRSDRPEAIPRLGGVAAVLGFCVGAGCLAALRWGSWHAEITTTQLVAIPLAFFIVFVCGLLEDTIGLATFTRFLMQTAAALLVLKAGWSFGWIYLPFIGEVQLGIFTALLSLLWIVGVTNAINLLDGLDGLAGGVVAIIAASMLVFSLWREDYLTVLIMGAAVGGCLGFLRKNWAPAQIYLGDAGSLTLGFVLAVVSVRSSIKAPAAIAILVPVLALGLPVIDTLLVMMVRFTRKSRGSLARRFARMFRADHNHLHHLMVRLGPSRGRIVLVIYSVAICFCAMALLVAASRNVSLGFVLIGLEFVVIFSIRRMGLHADARRISQEQRNIVREFILSKTVNGRT
jgi:UDP-GlcNAc:undecaprenyl-phosphate GlcNAc-1-phosphate transferase